MGEIDAPRLLLLGTRFHCQEEEKKFGRNRQCECGCVCEVREVSACKSLSNRLGRKGEKMRGKETKREERRKKKRNMMVVMPSCVRGNQVKTVILCEREVQQQ